MLTPVEKDLQEDALNVMRVASDEIARSKSALFVVSVSSDADIHAYCSLETTNCTHGVQRGADYVAIASSLYGPGNTHLLIGVSEKQISQFQGTLSCFSALGISKSHVRHGVVCYSRAADGTRNCYLSPIVFNQNNVHIGFPSVVTPGPDDIHSNILDEVSTSQYHQGLKERQQDQLDDIRSLVRTRAELALHIASVPSCDIHTNGNTVH